jgi:hypothetical protein
MVQECCTPLMLKPFEVVYLNIKNHPWANQVKVNIFSPFLKELLSVSNGTVSIDGPKLFHNYKKVVERRLHCVAKLDSSESSSSIDPSCNKDELQHITELVCFMDKEFVEIKPMYEAMEYKRQATWMMLWAFFPPGEKVAFIDELTRKWMRGEVLRTYYEETQQGLMLFVKVIKRGSNSQTWSKYISNKILHLLSERKEEKILSKKTYTIIIPAFESDCTFSSLDIHPVRFEEDLKATEELFLHHGQISIKEIRKCTDDFGTKSMISAGSCAKTYYAPLQDRVAAIKKLDAAAQPDSKFLSMVALVSRLKHENVVELIGYCLDGDLRVLAYEYATMGSLHDTLHGIPILLPTNFLNCHAVGVSSS